MKKQFFGWKFAFILVLTLMVNTMSATNYFVKVSGIGTGTSWDDALSPVNFVAKLSNGFVDGDMVYVAAGNYYSGVTKTTFFSITKGISIFGGFAPDITGSTTSITYPSVYETVFNGDIDKNGKLDNNNSERILEINSVSKIVLKGITITGAFRSVYSTVAKPAGIDVRPGSNLELYYCKILRNKTEASAGGMYVYGSKVYCYKTIISENEANHRGAGIRLENATTGSTLILESCLLANNNLQTDWGGAIQVSGNNSPLYCINTTIINNTAGRGGAAINSAAPTYIISSTIVNNTCTNVDNGQDVRCESVNQMRIINSIITGYPGKTPNIFLNGTDKRITSAGNNIIGTIGGTGIFTSSTSDLTGKYFADVFDKNTLSENGGYPKTIAIAPDYFMPALSALETFKTANAITANVAKDQRGFDRPQSNTSIGACEKSIPVKFNKIEKLVKLLKDPTSNYVFVVAHRGGWRNAPENSIPAFEKAIIEGVDMVEIDIQKTKDNDYILMHDGNIDRTTNGSGNVIDYTVAQLKQFRLRNSDGDISIETIPTLKEALLACKGKVLVNIDKGGDYLASIIPIIRETDTEDHVILKSSKTLAEVKTMLGSNLHLIYMPVVELDTDVSVSTINTFLTDFKPCAIEVSFKTDNFPQLSHTQNIVNAGSRVWINSLWESLCGGHEDEKAMSDPDANWGWILNQKATIIQTDRPKELINYLQGKGLRNTLGITIKKAPEGYNFTMDGKGSDPIWSKIQSTQLNYAVNGTPSENEHTASFKSFWTNEGIYFYGQHNDNLIAEKLENTSEDIYDHFRFYFNPTAVRDTEIESPFNRIGGRNTGDVYPESRSTMAYLYPGDDNKAPTGMMKRWEVYGNGVENELWPSLIGDKGQKVIHQQTDKGYTFEYFVPFSTIIPSETVLGAINGIPTKIGFGIDSYDGDGTSLKSILSWNNNTNNINAGSNINLFGEMNLSNDNLALQMNKIPSFTNISVANNLKGISNGSGIWGDYNNDGFLDLFYIGKDNSAGGIEVAYLYKNNGVGGFTPVTHTITAMQEATCTWLDFNNDGNLDLLIAGAIGGNSSTNASTRLYKNTGIVGNYTFEVVESTGFEDMYNEMEKCYRYVAVGDYDNDGHVDVLITGQNKSAVRRTDLYKNDNGTGNFIRQTNIFDGGTLRPLSSGSVSFGDMDNNGYLDILSNGYGDAFGSYPIEKGSFWVYRNNGDGTFNRLVFDINDWGTFMGQCSWADVNNDGFLDFIITGKHRNNSNQDINQAKIYMNDGTGKFSQKSSTAINIEPLNVSGLDWADVNTDGFIDLIISGYGNTSNGKTWVYLNNGTGVFSPYISTINNVYKSAVSMADYNKDGYSDAFICGFRDSNNPSVAEIWRNDGGNGIFQNTAPSVPDGLNASMQNGRVVFNWNSSSDDFAPSASLKYNLYVKAAAGNFVSMIIPSDNQTGFLKVSDISAGLNSTSYTLNIPDGIFTWGVQAIDNGKLSSSFATSEFSTTITDENSLWSNNITLKTVNGLIYVDTHNQLLSIRILDLTGKQLWKENKSGAGYLNKSFIKGIYFIEISSKAGVKVEKVIL